MCFIMLNRIGSVFPKLELDHHLPQVWAAAISNGPGNYPLNASYKTADDYAFQVSFVF